MNHRERFKTVFLYFVFICYIVLLSKILFLSRVSLLDLFDSHRAITRPINLIPFHSIAMLFFGSAGGGRGFAFGNVVGNIILFIPLGIYLPLLKTDKRVWTNLLVVFAVSLFAEVIQGLLGIGTADIDDVILNFMGGLIGIGVYKLFVMVLREEKKVRTAILIPSAVIGLPVIYYLMFMMKMRF